VGNTYPRTTSQTREPSLSTRKSTHRRTAQTTFQTRPSKNGFPLPISRRRPPRDIHSSTGGNSPTIIHRKRRYKILDRHQTRLDNHSKSLVGYSPTNASQPQRRPCCPRDASHGTQRYHHGAATRECLGNHRNRNSNYIQYSPRRVARILSKDCG